MLDVESLLLQLGLVDDADAVDHVEYFILRQRIQLLGQIVLAIVTMSKPKFLSSPPTSVISTYIQLKDNLTSSIARNADSDRQEYGLDERLPRAVGYSCGCGSGG